MAIGLHWLVLVLAGTGKRRLARLCEHRVLRFFGRYSYALYIIHVPMTMVVSALFLDPDLAPPVLGWRLPAQIAYLLVGLAASTILAVASWHLFEKHFLKLKNRFEYRVGPESRAISAEGTLDAVTQSAS